MGAASLPFWAVLLSLLRAGPREAGVRPERWPTRFAPAPVERLLDDPLSLPAAAEKLGASLYDAQGLGGLVSAGAKALGRPEPRSPVAVRPGAAADALPRSARPAILALIAELAAARQELTRALAPLSAEDRRRALAAAEASVGDDPFADPSGADFDAAGKVDLDALLAAARAAGVAADKALPALKAAVSTTTFAARWESPLGLVLVSAGDAELGAVELARTALIVRLGGRTTYRGPVAAAGEGELRAVLDLGGDCLVESSGPAAGYGRLGLGLFVRDGRGITAIRTGDGALGAGLLGIGLARVRGKDAVLVSGRLSQGAASFGVGVLDAAGDGHQLSATLGAQGYAGPRAAGVFRHDGAGLKASCGLTVPDPREELGFLSLCQGAGIGPRAFAAGGAGLAAVSGRGADLRASYFAQGSGYWHGLGALFARGKGHRFQSRRYGQGSGVHAGVGILSLDGHGHETVGWGVGPGFGWDYGLGYFDVRGDEGRYRSDWATGRADLGGRGFLRVRGKNNHLALAGIGTGSYSRAQAGYGLAALEGPGTRLRVTGLSAPIAARGKLIASPWGVISAMDGVILDPRLPQAPIEWPRPDRAALEAGQRVGAERLLAGLVTHPKEERVRLALFAAASAILDARPAEGGASALIGLSASDAPALARLVDADRYDELTWARLAAAGLGSAAARAALSEFPNARGPRRAFLLGWTRFGRAAESFPALEAALDDTDWRVRREAAGAIGALFAEDGGEEPGRLVFLKAAAEGTLTSETSGRKRLADLYAALALQEPAAPATRRALLAEAKSPFDAVAPEAVRLFVAELSSSPAASAAIAAEVADCRALRLRARLALRRAVDDAEGEVAAAALVSLGGLGDPEDAAKLGEGLILGEAVRREAAALGLARLGIAARGVIQLALSDRATRRAALAALAAAQSWDAETLALLSYPLEDARAPVRAAAIAAMSAVPGPLRAQRAKFLPRLKEIAAGDPDPSLRGSAALAIAEIDPKP